MKLSVSKQWGQKISLRLDSFNKKCIELSNCDYFTNVYGLGRSILGIGTLITLLFNNSETLFAEHLFANWIPTGILDEINLFHFFEYKYLWVSKLISLSILALVILGFYPRFTGVLHWWVCFSFYNSASIIDGGDQISAVITLFLIPITLLDSRSNHWIKNEGKSIYKNFIVFVSFCIIELQISILYLQASLEKPYKVNEWVDGTAIYYWLNNNQFGAPEWLLSFINPVLDIPWIIVTFNWSIIIFELMFFGALFMSREKRSKLLKYGIAFHFLIFIFHGLASFFFAMTGALILFLLPKEKILNLNFPSISLKLSK